jgi:hypothetical protein
MHLARNLTAGLIVAVGLVLLAGCSSSRDRHEVAPPATTEASPPGVTPAVSNHVETAPAPSPLSSADTMAPGILSWDARVKKYTAQPGERIVPFTFSLTNISSESLVIYATETTCGCTVAKLPSTPWVLAPGAGGKIDVTMDLKGRQGLLARDVIVFTAKGNAKVSVEVTLPPAPATNNH